MMLRTDGRGPGMIKTLLLEHDFLALVEKVLFADASDAMNRGGEYISFTS